MSQFSELTQNNKPRVNEFKPMLVKRQKYDQAATYMAALELVQYIDDSLTLGTRHYRTKSGQLLRTLDEVVHAILTNNMMWETKRISWPEDLARAA